MSTGIILEEENPDVDIIELTSVEHVGDSFMVLNAGVDETSPPLDSAPGSDSEESQSEFSDSSFLDIDLDDEIEVEGIDTTETISIDEHEVKQELDEVSSGMV